MYTYGFRFAVIAAAFLSSCAGAPSASSAFPPPWVSDVHSVYPDNAYLAVVETARDEGQARAAALGALTRIIRQNVTSVATAEQRLTSGSAGVTRSGTIGIDTKTTGAVDDLVGVKTEVYAPRGKNAAYAVAYLNRAEGAAVYGNLVREQESLVASLRAEAGAKEGTFDAVRALNTAVKAAEKGDAYLDILNVLDRDRRGKRASYGSASSVASERDRSAFSIVINVAVAGDSTERVNNTFASYFAERGFKTAAASSAAGRYTLRGTYTVEDTSITDNRGNTYVRFTLNVTLSDSRGVEIMTHTVSEREGHRTVAEARNRALLAAEQSITGDFAPRFDALLGLEGA